MEFKMGMGNRHLAIAEHMALHPECKQYEVAEIFGFTKEYISTLYCTDAFRAIIEEKRLSIHAGDCKHREDEIQAKVYTNLSLALDQVSQELDSPETPLKDINRTVEVLGAMTGLKRAGRTTINTGPQVHNPIMQVTQNVLMEAREYLTGAKPIPGKGGSNTLSSMFNASFHKKKEEEEPSLTTIEAGT